MTHMRIQAILQGDSMLAEDQYVNTWHFDTFDGGVDRETDFANLVTDLTAFYQAIDGYLSIGLQPSIEFVGYDLGDSEPRAPFADDTAALTLSASSGIPSEVAICLSYQGQRVSGQSQAQRRGRLYIGPLGANVLGTSIDGQHRPAAAFVTALAGAGTALLASTYAGTWWRVFSPTRAAQGGGLSLAMTPVTDGWVDDAWDIQRRRGAQPTTRTTFS